MRLFFSKILNSGCTDLLYIQHFVVNSIIHFFIIRKYHFKKHCTSTQEYQEMNRFEAFESILLPLYLCCFLFFLICKSMLPYSAKSLFMSRQDNGQMYSQKIMAIITSIFLFLKFKKTFPDVLRFGMGSGLFIRQLSPTQYFNAIGRRNRIH